MKRVNQAVNAIAAGFQLFSEGVQLLSDLKELVSNFKANVRRNNKANLQRNKMANVRRKNNEDQPKYKRLFTDDMIKKAYLNPDMKLSDYGHFIIANAAYIAVVAVEGNTPDSRKSVVLEFKENSAISIEDIQQLLTTYPEATLIVNDNGEGKILGELLKKMAFTICPYIGVKTASVMTIVKSISISAQSLISAYPEQSIWITSKLVSCITKKKY